MTECSDDDDGDDGDHDSTVVKGMMVALIMVIVIW
jgi:hypothetical protein